jgi:hypothetical protein
MENEQEQQEAPILETPTEPTPTIDDKEALLKEVQTLKAQKEHYKSKAEKLAAQIETPVAKPQLTKSELSKDEIRLIAKGVPQDEIDHLLALQAGYKAQGSDKSLLELYEKEPAVIALREKKEEEEKKKKASLGPSGKTGNRAESTVRNGMTREEHMAEFERMKANGEI